MKREDQDQLSLLSHVKACKSQDEGYFDDLIISSGGFKKDNIPRKETSMAKLKNLRPCFEKKEQGGTLTAGNSTTITDGAACLFMCSEQ